MGGQRGKEKKNGVFLCISLGLHYSGLDSPKVGGTLEIKEKRGFSLYFARFALPLQRNVYYRILFKRQQTISKQ